MILDKFQQEVFDKNKYNSTSKEKFKGYYYNTFDLIGEVANLEELMYFNSTDQTKKVLQLGKVISSSLLLLKELNFPINTEEFSLDEYKQTIKVNNQYKGITDYKYFTYAMLFNSAKLSNIIKISISDNKQELDASNKIEILNTVYFIITSAFELINHLNFNIDTVLEKYIESLPVKKADK